MSGDSEVPAEGRETAPECYQVVGFFWVHDGQLTRYDFRAKTIEMAMDILVALSGRFKDGISRASSLTVGPLYFTAEAGTQFHYEAHVKDALDITNWEIP